MRTIGTVVLILALLATAFIPNQAFAQAYEPEGAELEAILTLDNFGLNRDQTGGSWYPWIEFRSLTPVYLQHNAGSRQFAALENDYWAHGQRVEGSKVEFSANGTDWDLLTISWNQQRCLPGPQVRFRKNGGLAEVLVINAMRRELHASSDSQSWLQIPRRGWYSLQSHKAGQVIVSGRPNIFSLVDHECLRITWSSL